MIDEYPVLAIASAHAEGTSVMRGLAELRFKESDRLAAIVEGLATCGVLAEADDDKLTVQGRGGNVPTGGHVRTQFDHRIAMSFLVLGITTDAAVTIDDGSAIATSFPGFIDLMGELGAIIGSTDPQAIADEHSS